MKKINSTAVKGIIISFHVLLVAGALLKMFDVMYAWAVFAAGAVVAISFALRIAVENKTNDFRQSRLLRLHFLASLFLGVGAYLMSIDNTAWVVMLLVYAVLEFYFSFRNYDKQDKK